MVTSETESDLRQRLQALQERLDEAEETLRALRSGEVDTVVSTGPGGNQVYTLKGADTAYRMMVETMKTFGPDSFPGRLSCVIQGSTETTFYVLAVYFGSVGVKKTRYAVACALAAEFVGVLAAIGVTYLFFG